MLVFRCLMLTKVIDDNLKIVGNVWMNMLNKLSMISSDDLVSHP